MTPFSTAKNFASVCWKGAVAALVPALFVTAVPDVARAKNAQTAVQHCVQSTGAHGAYDIVQAEGTVPRVMVGQGGTPRGARVINDCLQDVYQVQPGFVATAAPTPVARAATSSKCQRMMARSSAEAFARSVGASILAGGIGAGIHASVLTSNFQKCMAAGTRPAYGGSVATSTCGRGSTVLVGGTAYCGKR